MTLPNIQSQHPDIYASFVEASNMERQASELLKQANSKRINSLEQLRMRQGWSKDQLSNVIGFKPGSKFIFHVLQGRYQVKERYLERVDAGMNTQLSDAQRSE